MRAIAVLNQKGGVGKTTTVTNTAAALAEMGAKVLVIDLDPQAHLTIHLGVEPQSVNPGSYEVMMQSANIREAVKKVRENLFLLGTNVNLVGAESELVSVVGREVILSEAIDSIKDLFDYIFIDCAPSLGLLTLNALAAVKEVFIPLQPHFLALQGFGKLLQTVDLVNRRINPMLRVTGILLCMYDSRALLPSEVKADIEQFLREARGSGSAWAEARIIPTLIRRNIKLAEAPSYGKTIFEYEPRCNGAEDYAAVARYVAAQSGDRVRRLPNPDALKTGAAAAAPTQQPQQSQQPPQPRTQPSTDAQGAPGPAQQPTPQAAEQPASNASPAATPKPIQPGQTPPYSAPPRQSTPAGIGSGAGPTRDNETQAAQPGNAEPSQPAHPPVGTAGQARPAAAANGSSTPRPAQPVRPSDGQQSPPTPPARPMPSGSHVVRQSPTGPGVRVPPTQQPRPLSGGQRPAAGQTPQRIVPNTPTRPAVSPHQSAPTPHNGAAPVPIRPIAPAEPGADQQSDAVAANQPQNDQQQSRDADRPGQGEQSESRPPAV